MNPLDRYSIAAFTRAQAGDLSDLMPKVGLFRKKKAKKEYYALMDAYLREIGLPKEYSAYLGKMQEYADAYHQVLSGKLDMKLNAKVALKEAEAIIGTGGSKSSVIHETCVSLSKQMGYRIDPESVSVREFYIMVKNMSNG